jgi:hypothetical protein
MSKFIKSALAGCALVSVLTMGGIPAGLAQDATGIDEYIAAEEPPVFDQPEAAVDAFKKALADDDFEGFAKLLGLDPVKLKASEGVMDTYQQIREGTAKKVIIEDKDGHKVLEIGDKLWPVPFPLVKGGDDGKWAFDTVAGIDEIIDRRVGENEIQTIATVRAYVDAQRDYAAVDHDDDGVMEYAQKLISSDGKADGLYWPADAGFGDSPAGDLISAADVASAKPGEGYYGYKYAILTGQGENIAGGKYDYIINDNMIAGYGLIAWPVTYGQSGIKTFVVNQQGIVYEADLGPDTEKLASATKVFDPDDKWDIVEE